MNFRTMKRQVIVCTVLFICGLLPCQAADLPALQSLFYHDYNDLYVPRFCGQNIERFLRLAEERSIDLEGSVVVRISGQGFFETSSFFGRGSPNRRQNLGTFHFILVAEGHVFDFDLHVPVVLREPDYFRLQLTPDEMVSSPISGLTHPKFHAREELANLEVKKFAPEAFIHLRGTQPYWVGQLRQLQDIDTILRIDRRLLSRNGLNRAGFP